MWKKFLSVLLIVSVLVALAQPAVFAQDEDLIVSGAWSTAGHAALANAMVGLQNADVIKAISEACDSRAYLKTHPANVGTANAQNYPYRGCNAYHAIGNYVASARYLYALARFYQYGTTVDFTAFDAALTGLGKSYEANNRLDIDSDIQYMLRFCESMMPADLSYRQRLATVAFGMLFHLLGDIYAHRSVVPTTSVSVTNRTSYGAGSGGNENKYFVMSDFRTSCSVHRMSADKAYSARRDELMGEMQQAMGKGIFQFLTAFWQYLIYVLFGRMSAGEKIRAFTAEDDQQLLQLAVNIPQNKGSLCGGVPCYYAMERIAQLGVLQFKDIKYFLNDDNYKTAQAYYEDKAPDGTFYAYRYEVTRAVMQQFVSDYLADKAFNPENFLPVYTEQMRAYGLRIDCLYNYLKQTNKALDPVLNNILRKSWWQSRGDSLFRYSTIVDNGVYFIDPATYPAGAKPAYDSTKSGKTAEDYYYNY